MASILIISLCGQITKDKELQSNFEDWSLTQIAYKK